MNNKQNLTLYNVLRVFIGVHEYHLYLEFTEKSLQKFKISNSLVGLIGKLVSLKNQVYFIMVEEYIGGLNDINSLSVDPLAENEYETNNLC